jgi:hypothetical protein
MSAPLVSTIIPVHNMGHYAFTPMTLGRPTQLNAGLTHEVIEP